MTDIVKRLRAANTTLNEGDCCGQLDASGTCTAPACIFGEALKMTHDAAAEIERLRAALREVETLDDQAECCGVGVYSHVGNPPKCCNQPLYGIDRARKVARAALKEDGDE